MTVNIRQLSAGQLPQHFLVGPGTRQRLVEVIRGEIFLRYRHQTPANSRSLNTLANWPNNRHFLI